MLMSIFKLEVCKWATPVIIAVMMGISSRVLTCITDLAVGM